MFDGSLSFQAWFTAGIVMTKKGTTDERRLCGTAEEEGRERNCE